MLITEELFVGGEWLIGSSHKWLDVVSPSTEKPLGRIVIPTFRELDRAVQAARTAFDDGPWPRLPIEERAAYLQAALTIFENKYQETAIAMQVDETGAPISFSRATTTALSTLLDRLTQDAAEVVSSETRQGITGKVRVLREPLGVVAAIVPWNAPVLAAAAKLFPALLMGCPTVLKTSPQTPFSAYLLAQSLGDAGIPAGVVSILPGGQDVGSYLISHPQVDAVTFIGSTETGRKIAAVCGQQLKSVTCELGGKSAAILTEGADIARHLPAVLAHSLTHNGQLHIATSRLLVHTSQVAEFGDALIDAVAAMQIGDPHDAATAIGPLVSERHRNRIEGYIASGQAQGAKLLYGGTRPEHLPVGYYLRPAIFGAVNNDMVIARDEIFGPVLSIIGYRDEAEAVRLANDSTYGLGGSVYSDDPEHAVDLAAKLQTGTCAVNNALFAGGGGPYGGAKASGLGRDGGPDGLHRYLRVKSIALPASWPNRLG
ncbi:MAG: aldehyde dehydrogenase family protein [Mycobacterium sp.]